MRFVHVLMMSACAAVASAPAIAQQLYVSPSSQSYYADGNSAPIYNNSGNPLPMEQMIAGKNAPSYNYNSGSNIQPYNSVGSGSSSLTNDGSPLTPAQVAQMRANRDALAQKYQEQYLQQAGQQSQGVVAPENFAGAAYNSVYGQPEQQRPTKKRLLYKERDDLMPTPPRLFNPDQ